MVHNLLFGFFLGTYATYLYRVFRLVRASFSGTSQQYR
jgi:hypothetical protein